MFLGSIHPFYKNLKRVACSGILAAAILPVTNTDAGFPGLDRTGEKTSIDIRPAQSSQARFTARKPAELDPIAEILLTSTEPAPAVTSHDLDACVPGWMTQNPAPIESLSPPTTPESMPSDPSLSESPSPFENAGPMVSDPNLFAGNLQGSALLASNTVPAANMVGGYLDPAAPVTMFRLRYDDAINNHVPDRGEYFYAKCGCFRQAGLDPNAQGPGGLTKAVSYMAVRPYLEYAFNTRFSVFGELPLQWDNFQSTPNPAFPSRTNTGGLGDMNAGFKYAMIAEPDQYLTFQFRTYIPTGDSNLGLGTDHVALEPSLLYYKQLSDRWFLQGQLSEYTPLGVTGYASNVIQYGSSIGWIATRGQYFTVIPTFEVVGWTFLGGKKLTAAGPPAQSASGDTIVNVKPGVRIGLGRQPAPALLQKQSIYAGFGIPITNEQFYDNLFRLEYRYIF